MAKHDIIVVGASAGGVDALKKLIQGLPEDFPASIFIVQHLSPHRESTLPDILQRVSKLPVSSPAPKEKIQPGHIYIAPPDKHLIIENSHMNLIHGPKENHSRPSVDVLFRSAALEYGPRVIGIVLSGSLGDGTSGLHAIKSAGGIAIVQDPEDAIYPSMPLSAVQQVSVDASLPLEKIPEELTKLIQQPVNSMKSKKTSKKNLAKKELEITKLKEEALNKEGEYGVPSVYSCPDCRGVLWEIKDGDLVRFRCRTGHGYLPEILSERQSDNIESTLWAAMTALEEKSSLSMRLANRFMGFGDSLAAQRFRTKSKDALKKAEVLRDLLMREEPK
jgi:two-component system, chemotaxis family, protein-glutamate methylesterase/glutaminase